MPGALELLPIEQIELQRMLDLIREEFERFGFLPISTSAMELSEVLLTKSGGETERQVYLVQSTGARTQGKEPDLALRFDLTVPLARYVAEHEGELAFPFRRYQIQPVWRGETPQRGRFREFIQCDIDVIDRGELSIRHDAEMPAVIAGIFTRLNIGDFTIRINNRRLLRGLLIDLGVEDPDRQADVLRELDKFGRDGEQSVETALLDMGLSPEAVSRLLQLAGRGPVRGDDAISLLESLPDANSLLVEGKTELLSVFTLLAAQGVDPRKVALDVSIARGLDYYTGTVYETTLDSHPELGSICSGGRYDDLASLYTNSKLPGVGISIGLTRLFWQLREVGLVGQGSTTVRVLLTLLDDPGLTVTLGIARDLRAAGINTEVTLEAGKLSRQLRYADRAGIPIVVIAGEEERERGTVQVRHLPTQHQQEVSVTDLVKTIQELD
ncbi:MAG TPA: histidine--tRNA ligase [Acidimicrobiia bacterium]|nr:histidine--tRNA ligase [Acidimicrobiia bacterium]